MINKGLFTSDKNYWETPQDFFDELHDKHNFTLDAAATDENAKLDNYYTIEDNALEQDWEATNDSISNKLPRNRCAGWN